MFLRLLGAIVVSWAVIQHTELEWFFGLIAGVVTFFVIGYAHSSSLISLSTENYRNEIKASLNKVVSENVWDVLVDAVSALKNNRTFPTISEPEFSELTKHCDAIEFENNFYTLKYIAGQLVLSKS